MLEFRRVASSLALLVGAVVLAQCSVDRHGGVPTGDIAFGDGVGDSGAETDGAPTEDTDTDVEETIATCTDCNAPAACVDGFCVVPEPGGCEPGATTTCYGEDAVMTCDATGTAYVPVDCPGGQACGNGSCKPALCQPGTTFCEGFGATKACNADGTGFEAVVPCPEGMYCTSGKCTDTCISDPKFGAYVGCAYWTVDLPNWPDPTINPTPEDLPHALVVANPNELDATLTFEPPPGVTLQIDDPVVPAGQSRVFLMPVINTEGTGVAQKGIRFSSTRPILAHQFNPWKAIWSNDASLLLPESLWGNDYVILSWPTDPRGLIQFPIPGLGDQENVNGFFTVVADEDDTEVTIQVTGRVAAGDKVNAMAAGAIQTITLMRGEILNVECEPETLFEECDLTGSTVSAKKPVAVFAGHESAAIGHPNPPNPDENGCCLDHLEEQMLPLQVLGDSYVAVKSKPRGNDPDLWRIQAAEAGVTVTTSPPQPGVNGVTLQKRGDWVEVYTTDSFEVQATGKIQIGQYLIGQEATSQGTGDPSLMLGVPTSRFRDFYVITVPPGYDTNWVTIVRPAGVTISGSMGVIADSEFTPIGSGAWELAYLEVPAGVHKLAGEEKFGITAYGYNSAMSYGYIGGLD